MIKIKHLINPDRMRVEVYANLALLDRTSSDTCDIHYFEASSIVYDRLVEEVQLQTLTDIIEKMKDINPHLQVDFVKYLKSQHEYVMSKKPY
jgi:hypothetical protein